MRIEKVEWRGLNFFLFVFGIHVGSKLAKDFVKKC
jgi:hypothetical protein